MPTHRATLSSETGQKSMLTMLRCSLTVKKGHSHPRVWRDRAVRSLASFSRVSSMSFGVSDSQATPFLSSPGAMTCRGLLPMATDLNCPGSGPGPPEHLIQSSAPCLQFPVPGAAPQFSVPFFTSEEGNGRRMVSLAQAISTIIFFPKNYVYDVKSQLLPWRYPSNLLITGWRRKAWFILPCVDNALSIRKKEWDYWYVLLDIF